MAKLILVLLSALCYCCHSITQNGERSAGSQVTCNTTAEQIGNNCYIFKDSRYDSELSWEEAFVQCQELGGHLATFETMNEMMLVKNFIRKRGRSKDYFIGGRNINRYTTGIGDWRWIKGDEMIELSYYAWDAKEPQLISDSRDCMKLYSDYYYNLKAAQCHRDNWRGAYICEV